MAPGGMERAARRWDLKTVTVVTVNAGRLAAGWSSTGDDGAAGLLYGA